MSRTTHKYIKLFPSLLKEKEVIMNATIVRKYNIKEDYYYFSITDDDTNTRIVVKDNNPKECITVETETNKTMPLDMSDILSREFRIVGNKFDND